MEFTIRRARREDCPAMLELIRELAVFERAPDEVTVSPAHFEESGFGENPVWWAFVACATGKHAAASMEGVAEKELAGAVPNPKHEHLRQPALQEADGGEALEVQNAADELPGAMVQLDEPVEPSIPEPVADAMPLMQDATHCQVIGFALYYIRYSTWKGQRMYLEDLLVTERWRCKGVGTALMDMLIATAKADALHGITWQVLKWNEPAIKFYERYGARFDGDWFNAAIDV